MHKSVLGAPETAGRSRAAVTALLLDTALAVACYVATYRLRFEVETFPRFLPYALQALPFIVGAQLTALTLSGVYRYRESRRWLPRLIGGIAAGSAIGTGLAAGITGLQGISRASFIINPLLLLMVLFAWRGALRLRRLTQRARALRADPQLMVDRADEEEASVTAGMIGVVAHRELLRNLVLKDLKLKYRGSVFGFLWSLANPLVMVTVYSVAFTYILRIRTEGFVFLLLLGVLTWTFFANSASMSTGSIVDSGGLVKSVFFPRAILPISTVLFNFAQYLLTLLVFVPLMMLIYQVPLSAPMLVYPVFLSLQLLCTIGAALLLSTATASFRDVRHILEIALSVLFWTTPVVYQFSGVPEMLRLPILLSPMSSFVVAYQEMFYYGRWPDVALWLAAGVYGVGGFVVGAMVFVSFEHRFAEQV
jgi:ABC-2 type transport system permease protein